MAYQAYRPQQSHYNAHPASSSPQMMNHQQQQNVHRNPSTASTYPGQQRQSQRPSIPPCPPGINSNHWRWFHTTDVDGSGQISPQELQQALVNGDHSHFDIDTIKMLLNLFDSDGNGTIGFNEFASIFQYIEDWQAIFRRFDSDRSGTIEPHELALALQQFQYNLSPRLIDLLCKKYGRTISNSRGQSGITFDRFVRACVTIKTLTDAFIKADTDRDGWVSISYEQFLDMVLSAP